uniref:Tf2-1-like SH3-like domain-containing protein n=1 Tax=Cajanus cajan TaxID=3821 RepID=A0A151S751_CAJCA|nr:hypothetical protein KK1_027577 [Cajanus cajan]
MSDRQFKIEDFVYVKFHPYRQLSVAFSGNAKLSLKYFGPFWVMDCIGTKSYKLDLPAHNKVHNVFHVSQLKKHVGNLITVIDLPYQQEDVFVEKDLEAILDRMVVRRKGMLVTKVFVKWKHHLPEDAT